MQLNRTPYILEDKFLLRAIWEKLLGFNFRWGLDRIVIKFFLKNVVTSIIFSDLRNKIARGINHFYDDIYVEINAIYKTSLRIFLEGSASFSYAVV